MIDSLSRKAESARRTFRVDVRDTGESRLWAVQPFAHLAEQLRPGDRVIAESSQGDACSNTEFARILVLARLVHRSGARVVLTPRHRWAHR